MKKEKRLFTLELIPWEEAITCSEAFIKFLEKIMHHQDAAGAMQCSGQTTAIYKIER